MSAVPQTSRQFFWQRSNERALWTALRRANRHARTHRPFGSFFLPALEASPRAFLEEPLRRSSPETRETRQATSWTNLLPSALFLHPSSTIIVPARAWGVISHALRAPAGAQSRARRADAAGPREAKHNKEHNQTHGLLTNSAGCCGERPLQPSLVQAVGALQQAPQASFWRWLRSPR